MVDVSRKPTAELVRELTEDLSSLVRKEVELARIEIMESVSAKLKGAGLIGVAVIASLPGLFFLVVALALAIPLSPAAGFAIVGGGLLVLAVVITLVGYRLVRKPAAPVTAVESMKEDVRWARDQLTR